MRATDPLGRAAERVVDGTPVDWDAAEASCRSDAERAQLTNLRLIAALCRATGDLAGEEPDPQQPQPALDDDERSPWGDLRVLRRLGRGAFGDVYLAHDATLHRAVALKLLRTGADAERRLLAEARALARVRHPNVVTVHGADVRDGRAGFWMEYLEGTTLEDDLAARGPASAGEAALVGRDVCLALAAVHRAGIVHRDVKARNIIREASGRIVLMDFGAGQALTERDGPPNRVVGTPVYLAPELLAGERASVASDVYAVGVLLFHLLTGEYPHEAASLEDLAAQHAAGTSRALADLRPDLPGTLIHVVERALDRDPARRFASAGEMASALSVALEVGSPRWEGARRTVLGAMALTALLLALLSFDRARWLGIDTGPPQSIAVPPLVVEPGARVDPSLASGLTRDIVRELQRRGIHVPGAASTATLAGFAVPEFRARLDADAVLKGSVGTAAGGGLRVRVSLLSTRDERSLLSRDVRHDSSGWAVVASTIAGEVARVAGRPSVERAQPTVSDAAYTHYTRGRVLAEERRTEKLLQAIDAYKSASALDPAFPGSWAGLADAYIALGVSTFGPLRPIESRRLAKEAVLRAYSLDPSSAEVNTTMGFIAFFHDWSWGEADRYFRRALDLEPGYALGHHWYADYLNAMRRFPEALQEIEAARRLEPLSLMIQRDVAWHYFFQERYGDAVRQLRGTLAKDGTYGSAHSLLGRALVETGAYADARRHLERAGLSRPTYLAFLAYADAAEGRREDAGRHLREAIQLSPSAYLAPYHVALVHNRLGDTDAAVLWLERAYDEQDFTLVNLFADPRLASLRAHPRVAALMARMAFPRDREPHHR